MAKAADAFSGLLQVVGAVALRRTRRLLGMKPPLFPDAASLITYPTLEVEVERVSDTQAKITWTLDADSVMIAAGEVQLVGISDGSKSVVVAAPHPRTIYTLTFVQEDETRTIRAAERILPLEGAFNFRDIGGYPAADGRRVRWGRVYRSGNLAGLTDADVALLSALEVKLVCDLRSESEVISRPDRLPTDNPPLVVAHPVGDVGNPLPRIASLIADTSGVDTILLKGYTETLIDNNPQVIGGVIRRLANADSLPAIIHCTAGKDRAGMTTAILLLALGVPDEIVIADYSLSNLRYETFRDIVSASIRPLRRLGVTIDDLQPLIVANPRTLRLAVAHVRETYGSVEAYLAFAGVDAPMLEQVKMNLLE